MINCYRRKEDSNYKDGFPSSSKSERDMDIRRKRDPRKEEKKDNCWRSSTAQENRKRHRSVSPDDKLKIRKENSQKYARKNKKGSIFCICSKQTYEHGMVKCSECKRYSHAECFTMNDLSIEHICGGCAAKPKKECRNKEIQNIVKQEAQNKDEKSKFIFKLQVRRVLNYILREEFKHILPGVEPNEEFLKLKFGKKSSYANKMLFYLFKADFLSVENGFKINLEKIREYINNSRNNSGFVEQFIRWR